MDHASARHAQTAAVVELGKQLLFAAKDGEVDLVRDLMSKGAPFTTDWVSKSNAKTQLEFLKSFCFIIVLS